jgi:hypothetical protein
MRSSSRSGSDGSSRFSSIMLDWRKSLPIPLSFSPVLEGLNLKEGSESESIDDGKL